MGVPVVGFYGERRDTRAGVSMLKQVGLEGLVVPINAAQDYIARAIGLINDVPALDTLHKNLRAMVQKSATIRPRFYIKSLEDKIEQILNEKANA